MIELRPCFVDVKNDEKWYEIYVNFVELLLLQRGWVMMMRGFY